MYVCMLELLAKQQDKYLLDVSPTRVGGWGGVCDVMLLLMCRSVLGLGAVGWLAAERGGGSEIAFPR
jgi:hypothetical protein